MCKFLGGAWPSVSHFVGCGSDIQYSRTVSSARIPASASNRSPSIATAMRAWSGRAVSQPRIMWNTDLCSWGILSITRHDNGIVKGLNGFWRV